MSETTAIHKGDNFYNRTGYHLIDPTYPEYTTKMFRVMKSYRYENSNDTVIWILANKTLTINNIQFLEGNGWEIIGVENMCKEIYESKKDFGFDQANIKLTIRKRKEND